jgi:hypothetical protein
MFGVETHSFLPDQQSDRRDLARQRESRHVRLHSAGQTSLVEILEWSGHGSREGGGALEDVFQIVIVIAIETADVTEVQAVAQGNEGIAFWRDLGITTIHTAWHEIDVKRVFSVCMILYGCAPSSI